MNAVTYKRHEREQERKRAFAALMLLLFLAAFAIQSSHSFLHSHRHDKAASESASGLIFKAAEGEHSNAECKLCQFTKAAEKFFISPERVSEHAGIKAKHVLAFTLKTIKAAYKLASGRAPPALAA